MVRRYSEAAAMAVSRCKWRRRRDCFFRGLTGVLERHAPERTETRKRVDKQEAQKRKRDREFHKSVGIAKGGQYRLPGPSYRRCYFGMWKRGASTSAFHFPGHRVLVDGRGTRARGGNSRNRGDRITCGRRGDLTIRSGCPFCNLFLDHWVVLFQVW